MKTDSETFTSLVRCILMMLSSKPCDQYYNVGSIHVINFSAGRPAPAFLHNFGSSMDSDLGVRTTGLMK